MNCAVYSEYSLHLQYIGPGFGCMYVQASLVLGCSHDKIMLILPFTFYLQLNPGESNVKLVFLCNAL